MFTHIKASNKVDTLSSPVSISEQQTDNKISPTKADTSLALTNEEDDTGGGTQI